MDKTDDNIITFDWHTDICESIVINNGINTETDSIIEYSDILETWKDEIIASAAVAVSAEYEFVDDGKKLQITLSDGTTVTSSDLTGPKGRNFAVKKEYASIQEMSDDFSNPEVERGDFVVIVSNVEDEDNAKLYVKSEDSWKFITSMSGTKGIEGPKGDKGDKGDSGDKGDNGNSIFVRYSAFEDGTGFKKTWERGQRYLGIYIGQTASTDKTEYTWSKFIPTNISELQNDTGFITKKQKYEVGDVYISKNPTSPAEKFGGTWTQIQEVFLLAAGSKYTVTNNMVDGGSERVTLEIQNLPLHSHTLAGNILAYSPDNLGNMKPTFVSGGATTGGNMGGVGLMSDYGYDLRHVSNTGENVSHNNMPPFKIYYMWEKIQ